MSENKAAQTMECLALLCGIACIVVSIMSASQVDIARGRCFKIMAVATAFFAG